MNDYPVIVKIEKQWVKGYDYTANPYGTTTISNLGVDKDGKGWYFETKHVYTKSGFVRIEPDHNYLLMRRLAPYEGEDNSQDAE